MPRSRPAHLATRATAAGTAPSKAHIVRADALRLYPGVVRELGGDPDALLRQAGIEIDDSVNAAQFIPYQKLAELLHITAAAVDRADFGLILAARQKGAVLGPLAMRNSPTLGDALTYYIAHAAAFSSAVSIALEEEQETGRPYFRFEVYVSPLRHSQQVAEHAMGLLHHILIALTDGKVRSRELWFSHGPVSPIAAYRRYFGTRVEMTMPFTALFLSDSDLSLALPHSAPGLFRLADAFIDGEYSMARPLSAQVSSMLMGKLSDGLASKTTIARLLNLHPKTLGRRLSEENTSFRALREEVRREAARRYITESLLPLAQIAVMLGYSEASALSRACRQWFGYSPREMRRRAAAPLSEARN